MNKLDGIESSLLISLNFAIFFAKKNNVFLEFYIYTSSYDKFSQMNDDIIDVIEVEEAGIGMMLILNNEEFYYYEEGLNPDPLFEILRNEFKFNIDFTVNDNCLLNYYGDMVNPFKTVSYKKKIDKFFKKKKDDKYLFSISADYEKILIYSTQCCVCDGRVFQKLLIYENGNIIETYSSNNKEFVGELFNPNIIQANLYDELPGLQSVDYSQLIFMPKASGIIFHEVCGHMLEYDYYNSKNPFYGKVGKIIAPSYLTVIDDPNVLYGNVQHVDDEGFPLDNVVLIKNGVLMGIMGSKVAELDLEKQSFDIYNRARKESYKFPSTGRTYCLVVSPGSLNIDTAFERYPNTLIVQDFSSACYDADAQIIECSTNNTYIFDGSIFNKIENEISFKIQGDIFLQHIIELCDKPEYYENMCYSSSGFVSNSTFTPAVIVKNENNIFIDNMDV